MLSNHRFMMHCICEVQGLLFCVSSKPIRESTQQNFPIRTLSFFRFLNWGNTWCAWVSDQWGSTITTTQKITRTSVVGPKNFGPISNCSRWLSTRLELLVEPVLSVMLAASTCSLVVVLVLLQVEYHRHHYFYLSLVERRYTSRKLAARTVISNLYPK